MRAMRYVGASCGAAIAAIAAGCGGVEDGSSPNEDPIIGQVQQAAVPARVTLVGPFGIVDLNDQFDCAPRFRWNAELDADSYEIRINDAASGPPFLQKTLSAAEANCNAGVGECFFAEDSSKAMALGPGNFVVRAINTDGTGTWSSTGNFEIVVPTQVTNLSPSQGSTVEGTDVTFRWDASSDGMACSDENDCAYRIQLFLEDGTILNAAPLNPADLGCSGGGGTTCSYTWMNVPDFGVHSWQVLTWEQQSATPRYIGCWSDRPSFTLREALTAPTPISPDGCCFNSDPDYVFSAVAAAVNYEIQVEHGGGTFRELFSPATAGCSSGMGNCSYNATTTLLDGPARWWVRAVGESHNGPWSSPSTNFTVGGGLTQPQPISPPSPNPSDNTPVLTWSPAGTGAIDYRIFVKDSAGSQPAILEFVDSTAAGCDVSGNCSFEFPTALDSGLAIWWVRAQNSQEVTPWSSASAFIVP